MVDNITLNKKTAIKKQASEYFLTKFWPYKEINEYDKSGMGYIIYSPHHFSGSPVVIVDITSQRPEENIENLADEYPELYKVLFEIYSEKWKEEIKSISILQLMIKKESYKKILQLGTRLLPFILKDLEKTHDYWFHALEKITGENPVLTEHKGDFDKMSEDWINWGKSVGLI